MAGIIQASFFTLFCGLAAGLIMAWAAYLKKRNVWFWAVPSGFAVTLVLASSLFAKIKGGMFGLSFNNILGIFIFFCPPYTSLWYWSGAGLWALALIILCLLPAGCAGKKTSRTRFRKSSRAK